MCSGLSLGIDVLVIRAQIRCRFYHYDICRIRFIATYVSANAIIETKIGHLPSSGAALRTAFPSNFSHSTLIVSVRFAPFKFEIKKI